MKEELTSVAGALSDLLSIRACDSPDNTTYSPLRVNTLVNRILKIVAQINKYRYAATLDADDDINTLYDPLDAARVVIGPYLDGMGRVYGGPIAPITDPKQLFCDIPIAISVRNHVIKLNVEPRIIGFDTTDAKYKITAASNSLVTVLEMPLRNIVTALWQLVSSNEVDPNDAVYFMTCPNHGKQTSTWIIPLDMCLPNSCMLSYQSDIKCDQLPKSGKDDSPQLDHVPVGKARYTITIAASEHSRYHTVEGYVVESLNDLRQSRLFSQALTRIVDGDVIDDSKKDVAGRFTEAIYDERLRRAKRGQALVGIDWPDTII